MVRSPTSPVVAVALPNLIIARLYLGLNSLNYRGQCTEPGVVQCSKFNNGMHKSLANFLLNEIESLELFVVVGLNSSNC